MDPDSLDGLEQIVEIADRFEAAWRQGGCPRIEDYLAQNPQPDGEELLHDLLCIELEIRRERGEGPKPEEYLGRFPQDRELVEDAFATG